MRVETIDDTAGLEALRDAWDGLAVARSSPYSAPAWQLAWWREDRPPEASLLAVAAHDGRRLVALAPFYCVRRGDGVTHVALLGTPSADGIEPVAAPGDERVAAAACAEALKARLRSGFVVTFRGLDPASPWPRLLAESFPAWTHVEPAVPSPTIDLRGTYDGWLAGRSSNTRQQLRRYRRRLEENGAVYRRMNAGEAEADIASFARLHRGRWDRRGGSAVLTPGVERMLGDVARELLPEDRFRLYAIDVDGRTIATQVVLAAGDRAAHWLGGFDEGWSRFHPGIQALVAGIEDAFGTDAVFDLGGGAQSYKAALAEHDAAIVTTSVIPRGSGFLRARASLLPRHARQALACRLPEPPKRRLRAAARRLGGFNRT